MTNTNNNEIPQMNVVPYIIEKTKYGERMYDIFTKLLEDRIIFLGTPINDLVANSIVAQLLYLDYKDSERDIVLYINSPGGAVSSALAIYDTMQLVKANVRTVGFGIVASAAAVILSAGSKGKRQCLPNTDLLLHQVQVPGIEGSASEIEIAARQILKLKNRLNEILSKHTGQPLNVVEKDTDRDFWMTGEEAKQYGLIDQVIAFSKDKKSENRK